MRVAELCHLVALVLVIGGGVVHASSSVGDEDIFADGNDMVLPLKRERYIVLGESAEALDAAILSGALLLPEKNGEQGLLCRQNIDRSNEEKKRVYDLSYLGVTPGGEQPLVFVVHIDTDFAIGSCDGCRLATAGEADSGFDSDDERMAALRGGRSWQETVVARK